MIDAATRDRQMRMRNLGGASAARPVRKESTEEFVQRLVTARKPSSTPAPIGPKPLDHPAMQAWRAHHQVSEAEHRSRLVFGGSAVVVTRTSAPGADVLAFRPPASSAAAGVLRGYFAIYDTAVTIDSAVEGRFTERLRRGVFARSFSEKGNAIPVLFAHGKDASMGDKVIARPTLLEEREAGAYVEAVMMRGTPDLVVAGLEANVYSSSFRFTVPDGGDEWVMHPKPSASDPEGLPQRSLVDVTLHEFGPCTFAAYPDAGLSIT